MSPFLVIFAIVFVTNVLAVPVGYGLDPKGYFDLFKQRLDDAVIWRAYLWTLYAVGLMLFLYYLLGTHQNMLIYQRRPFTEFTQRTYRQLWVGSFVLGLLLTAVMFIQADYRIPILEGVGAEYWVYAKMRTDFADAINQRLFNLTLFLVATPNLILGWFCIHFNKRLFQAFSLVLFVIVSSFTLARSPAGMALLMVLNFYLLSRSVSTRHVAAALAGVTVMIVGAHFLAGKPGGYASRLDYLWVRVLYGQWMTLPYYFDLFLHQTEPVSALLPVSLQELMGNVFVSPARTVMFEMAPEAVAEGTAGVASSFFIGEAYAVAGLAGVILSPLIVSVEIWVITICFRVLKVNVITTCLYAWFFLKILLGLVSGFSAFVASSLQMMLLLVVYWAFVQQLTLLAIRRHALQV